MRQPYAMTGATLAAAYRRVLDRWNGRAKPEPAPKTRRPGRPRMTVDFYRDHYADILSAYAGGATLKEIGQQFGKTGEYIRQLAKRANLPARGRRHRCRPPCSEIARRIAAGERAYEVARTFGRPLVRSSMRCHRLHSPQRHVCRVCPEVIRLYESGVGTPEICRRLGLTLSWSMKLLQRHGITLRPRGYFKGQRRPRYDRAQTQVKTL